MKILYPRGSIFCPQGTGLFCQGNNFCSSGRVICACGNITFFPHKIIIILICPQVKISGPYRMIFCLYEKICHHSGKIPCLNGMIYYPNGKTFCPPGKIPGPNGIAFRHCGKIVYHLVKITPRCTNIIPPPHSQKDVLFQFSLSWSRTSRGGRLPDKLENGVKRSTHGLIKLMECSLTGDIGARPKEHRAESTSKHHLQPIHFPPYKFSPAYQFLHADPLSSLAYKCVFRWCSGA